jgi:hypothetical protein
MSSPIKKNNNQFLLLKNSFDEFIKIALINILGVRDNNFNSNNFNNSSNSDNLNKNSFSLSFDDSFNSNISNNSSSILYIIEIYIISNNDKILCEKWTFQFDKLDFSDKNYLLKLNILLRSVYCISRIIPCYNIFINEKTNFEYKLVSNRKQTFFNDTKTKIHYITLQNLSVEYISNEDIKKLEEESFQKKHNGFILLKLPNNNNKKKNNNRLSLNPNMIFQKRKKRLLSFESKDNENISDIVNNNNNNNVSFQSDFNEIKHLFYKNKSNGSSMKKFSTMDSSNNFDDSCKLEFEILENENDF